MPVLPRALEIQGEITAIRRDIHAHPELAYEETRTSDIVAAKLQGWGLEVTRGLGKTGLVGTLRKGNSLKAIGLRADMDFLLHVFAPDLAAFSDFALKALLRMPGVKGTRSSFIMQAIKSDLAWAPAPRLR